MVKQWRWTTEDTDEELARHIREDGIDILVDLAGHTANNRLCVLAQKTAPIQATWLGYMNTTGLTAVDYRLTDDVLDPPSAPVRDTEELVRLPAGMCCFAPPDDAPAVGILPALSKPYVTFGSLHSLFKLNKYVFELWSQLLKAIPKARLLLFHHTLTETARRHLRQQFAERGIADDRLDLRQGCGAPGYLGIYHEIDISLDTFPYSGGVTTCEALWMGVPVLSLCGVRPAGRNAASLLTRVGLASWVVSTPEQYLALGVKMATDMEHVSCLRAGLRERMAATVCDAARFTRGLEAAYRALWQRWCAKVGQSTMAAPSRAEPTDPIHKDK
jgi:predicted O-linked N-acetylglucosamine transferase (SPINDLY family)